MTPCPTDHFDSMQSMSFEECFGGNQDFCETIKSDPHPRLSIKECNKFTSPEDESFHFSVANFGISSAPKLPGRFQDSKNQREPSFFFADSSSIFFDCSTTSCRERETSSLVTSQESAAALPEGDSSCSSWRFSIRQDSDLPESYNWIDYTNTVDDEVEETDGHEKQMRQSDLVCGHENTEDEAAALPYTKTAMLGKSSLNGDVPQHRRNSRFSNGCSDSGPLRLPIRRWPSDVDAPRSQNVTILLETVSEETDGKGTSVNDKNTKKGDCFVLKRDEKNIMS